MACAADSSADRWVIGDDCGPPARKRRGNPACMNSQRTPRSVASASDTRRSFSAGPFADTELRALQSSDCFVAIFDVLEPWPRQFRQTWRIGFDQRRALCEARNSLLQGRDLSRERCRWSMKQVVGNSAAAADTLEHRAAQTT
jgi:hypothetical protein